MRRATPDGPSDRQQQQATPCQLNSATDPNEPSIFFGSEFFWACRPLPPLAVSPALISELVRNGSLAPHFRTLQLPPNRPSWHPEHTFPYLSVLQKYDPKAGMVVEVETGSVLLMVPLNPPPAPGPTNPPTSLLTRVRRSASFPVVDACLPSGPDPGVSQPGRHQPRPAPSPAGPGGLGATGGPAAQQGPGGVRGDPVGPHPHVRGGMHPDRPTQCVCVSVRDTQHFTAGDREPPVSHCLSVAERPPGRLFASAGRVYPSRPSMHQDRCGATGR